MTENKTCMVCGIEPEWREHGRICWHCIQKLVREPHILLHATGRNAQGIFKILAEFYSDDDINRLLWADFIKRFEAGDLKAYLTDFIDDHGTAVGNYTRIINWRGDSNNE